jgi:hypothetical protein
MAVQAKPRVTRTMLKLEEVGVARPWLPRSQDSVARPTYCGKAPALGPSIMSLLEAKPELVKKLFETPSWEAQLHIHLGCRRPQLGAPKCPRKVFPSSQRARAMPRTRTWDHVHRLSARCFGSPGPGVRAVWVHGAHKASTISRPGQSCATESLAELWCASLDSIRSTGTSLANVLTRNVVSACAARCGPLSQTLVSMAGDRGFSGCACTADWPMQPFSRVHFWLPAFRPLTPARAFCSLPPTNSRLSHSINLIIIRWVAAPRCPIALLPSQVRGISPARSFCLHFSVGRFDRCLGEGSSAERRRLCRVDLQLHFGDGVGFTALRPRPASTFASSTSDGRGHSGLLGRCAVGFALRRQAKLTVYA